MPGTPPPTFKFYKPKKVMLFHAYEAAQQQRAMDEHPQEDHGDVLPEFKETAPFPAPENHATLDSSMSAERSTVAFVTTNAIEVGHTTVVQRPVALVYEELSSNSEDSSESSVFFSSKPRRKKEKKLTEDGREEPKRFKFYQDDDDVIEQELRGNEYISQGSLALMEAAAARNLPSLLDSKESALSYFEKAIHEKSSNMIQFAYLGVLICYKMQPTADLIKRILKMSAFDLDGIETQSNLYLSTFRLYYDSKTQDESADEAQEESVKAKNDDFTPLVSALRACFKGAKPRHSGADTLMGNIWTYHKSAQLPEDKSTLEERLCKRLKDRLVLSSSPVYRFHSAIDCLMMEKTARDLHMDLDNLLGGKGSELYQELRKTFMTATQKTQDALLLFSTLEDMSVGQSNFSHT